MISKNIEKALQQQIALEGYSSAFYLSMASWMDCEGFEGTAAFFYRQSEVASFPEQDPESFANRADSFFVEPGAPEPDDVDTPDRVLPIDHRERRHIAARSAEAAHQCKVADSDELVNDAIAGNENVAADLDITAEQSAVG